MNRQQIIRYLRPFKNRYVLALSVFGIWMLFFDAYNLPSQNRTGKQLEQLQQRRDFYSVEIARLHQERQRLIQNPKELERVARERYYLQKPNEDVYVIARPAE
jgi:cell division protein DivIC